MTFWTAPRVYLTLRGLIALANTIMFTTYAIYYVVELGLNPFQLVLIGTVLEITIVIFESITGILADTYSRRLSIIIGMFMLGSAYIIEGSIPFFSESMMALAIPLIAGVLFAEFIRGIGETFLSGALQAWVTDEVGEDKISSLFLKGTQFSRAAMVVGVALSVGLASIALNLPFLVGGVLFLILGILLIMTMKETSFIPEKIENRSPVRAMYSTFQDGISVIKGRPLLIMVLFVTLFTGAAYEGFDRLWEAHFLQTFTLPELGDLKPVVWFGIITLVGNVLSIIAIELFKKRFDTTNQQIVKKSLFWLTCCQVIGLIIFGLAGNFAVAIGCYWFLSILTAISYPILDTWVNQNIDRKVRATVLSFLSQSDALGQSAGGPFVGAVGTRYTLRAAMVLSGILLVPAAMVYGKIARKRKDFKAGENQSA
ncbi:MFS transporter [Alkalihalobacillus sp. AL-G]|uniref:MFS transporter n=1 Tax=Alkalihalobacillus sp. AL-G TaxID=2926399 RepID=UPI00272C6D40|nr:MFS transporter [Alkalihalobacillus sp. AL-G]WLD92705.1 MFS transporter [Alkalihalobacillus sp. AL-G]